MSGSRKKVVIYVPCYNEEGNVREMAKVLTDIMSKLPYEYRIIFRDNHSTDRTFEILKEIAAQDKKVAVIRLGRNYATDHRQVQVRRNMLGDEDVRVVIPCDFQEPPELIPEFLSWWEKGYKVVAGKKTSSEEGKVKYFARSVFYKIMNGVSDIPQYEHMSGTILTDRSIFSQVDALDGVMPLRNVIADMGIEVKFIEYRQRKRKSGKSSYNLARWMAFSIRSVVSVSTAPLRIITMGGAVVAILSLLMGLVYLVLKLVFWNRFSAGTAPILIGIFFIGAVQLFCMGVIGEYIGDIHNKVSPEPNIQIEDTINLDSLFCQESLSGDDEA